jgi:two-component system cell cycle sensor histidine kinase/response regulator CckA
VAATAFLGEETVTDPCNILIVDDDPQALRILRDILSAAEGYRVRLADSGQLALASFEAELPQLILLDVRMPDMDGFEVCRQLKSYEDVRDVPLIFISATEDYDERVEGLALGAVDFISKPFRREELLARVRTHLDLGRLRADLKDQVARQTAGLRLAVERLEIEITDHRRAEQELRESEARFRNMADTAPVMIWVSAPDKLCTFFNKGWLAFTGRTIEQEVGNGWAENVHPDDLDRCWDTYSSAFNARRSFLFEYRLRRADGEYRWVLDNGIPRFEPDGVFAGYIGSCVDITDLKQSHEEDLTKQKLETVGTLAGGIAHDFNNLLGGVLAQSELALAELASGSNPVAELQRIRDGAIRGAEIVRQLMIYAGEETEVPELVGVSEIVEDMLELLKVSVSKHVSVEADLGKQLPAVRANPSQIRQVVMNLFYNASEAIGDRDGVIRVTTRSVIVGGDSPVETPEPLAKGDYVQLEISDTGRGMTPEVQARIFDTFFTTKVGGNHGLGLATVQGIVEQLHGTIQLSSAPGKGTAFQILLPSEESMVAATHRAIARDDDEIFAAQGATILIVEDEDLLRQGVSKMLRKRGFSVFEASDGSAALDVIRAQKDGLDVLLLDITLPGMPSREVYEEAKRLIPNLPMIVTSAHSREITASLLASRIDYFIRKPFSVGDLIDMVRQSLSS